MQAVAPLEPTNEPAGHLAHSNMPSLAVNVPAPHAVGVVEPAGQALPAWQAAHSAAPADAAKLPAAQRVHEDIRAVGACEPAKQGL